MPFDEIYTPSPLRRRSIQLQFTPLTPIRESPHRLSITPPKLPFSNRTLGVGTAIFLIISAIYKSGLVGILMRLQYPSIKGPALASDISDTLVLGETQTPLEISPTLPSFEVVKLLSRVSQLEDREVETVNRCNAQHSASEAEIARLSERGNKCSRDMKSLEKKYKKATVECEEALGQLEIEQVQIVEKMKTDYATQLDNLLLKKNAAVEDLSTQISELKLEKSNLNKQVLATENAKIFSFVDRADEHMQDVVPPAIEGKSDDFNFVPVWLLSAAVVVLSSLTVYLWLDRQQLAPAEIEPLKMKNDESELTAIEAPDPEEQERIAFAVEDMRASIAREVHAQIELIELHHEREMSIMKAIVEETRKSSVEISTLMKEVVDETCAVSTNGQNSPCSRSSSSCLDLSRDTPDISSLSAMLETGMTPIRVPLKDKLALNSKPSPSAPTCYSIASPSRRLQQRADSSSSGDWSDEEEENGGDQHRKVMANIWNNFTTSQMPR